MISQAEIDEVFRKPAVREVACEIRFAPRLRIMPEIWRLQDRLAESYPQIGEERITLPEMGTIQSYVFASGQEQRTIKVSQETFVVIFNRYTTFEDFKTEAVARILDFSIQFEVANYHRVGLRYVNHIALPPGDPIQGLQRYVNVPVDFDRFEVGSIEQFMTEFRLRGRLHKLTLRAALIPVPSNPEQMLHILDLDAFSHGRCTREQLPGLLDVFHTEIQVQFLQHVREEYKQVMRGTQ